MENEYKGIISCNLDAGSRDFAITAGIWNLQFRENVAGWICFYDRKDMFKAFLDRVLRLKEVCLCI